MTISNERSDADHASLNTKYWKGMKIGADYYPTKDRSGSYLVAGEGNNCN